MLLGFRFTSGLTLLEASSPYFDFKSSSFNNYIVKSLNYKLKKESEKSINFNTAFELKMYVVYNSLTNTSG